MICRIKPEEIEKLYKKAIEGFDIVLACRKNRKDSIFKRIGSKLFYLVFNYMLDINLDSSVGNFGIYRYRTIKALLQMKDHIRYFPAMICWVGFRKTSIEVVHMPRSSGSSSYSFTKLTKLAFDNIIAFSDKPLRICVKIGFMISTLSIIIAFSYLFVYLEGNIQVMGFMSIILSIWFIGGVIIFTLGILGVYLGKVFERVKDRPLYIIKDSININD